MAERTERKKILSVTLADCEVQHFRAGGNGGQKQNKTSSASRVIHHPSGARGECREERSQLQNTKRAFRRMTEHPKFKIWLNKQLYGYRDIEAEVEAEMALENIKVEYRIDGEWVTQ